VGAHAALPGVPALPYAVKVEATPTWYGLFLKDGTRLGAIDAITTPGGWGGVLWQSPP
jgi:hypothetical protein